MLEKFIVQALAGVEQAQQVAQAHHVLFREKVEHIKEHLHAKFDVFLEHVEDKIDRHWVRHHADEFDLGDDDNDPLVFGDSAQFAAGIAYAMSGQTEDVRDYLMQCSDQIT